MNGHGRGEGRGVVAPLPWHQGWTFPPLRGVSCAICSLWLWDPYGKVFSFPSTSLFLVYQQISAAAKLGRWGTQHKEMAHPLTQPVRCCWSSPCEFAQALWEGEIFAFGLVLGIQVSLMCGTKSGRCWEGQVPSAQDPTWSCCGLELVVAVHKKREKKVKLRAGEPTHCCVSCSSFWSCCRAVS